MKKVPWIMLLLILAAFAFGLSHLFRLRFEVGDVYPEYSTFRADPLGCKALFESLGPLRPTRRHLEPLSKLPVGKPTTLFFLGADPGDLRFTRDQFEALENFIRTGGRLVLTLRPVYGALRRRLRSGSGGSGAPAPGSGRPPGSARAKEHASSRWGFDFQHEPLARDPEGVYQPELAFPASAKTATATPSSIPVYTALWFTNLTESWTVVYARTNDRPILVERPWGSGSVVLCADSFLVSNQALLLNRQPALLVWLAGRSREFLFDETHLGVHTTPGVAMLLRQYHLHGVLVFLLVLAAVYIWKNALPFLPALQDTSQPGAGRLVTGRESAAGFVTLLRRNIPSANLLKTCLEQWQAQRPVQITRERLEAMQAVIDAENARPPKQQDPVRAYNEFARILSRRSWTRSHPQKRQHSSTVPDRP